MIIMCFVGYPLLIMEIGIGQKIRHNSITAWTTINPQLGGIGIVICLVTIAMASYYGTIISWGIKYMTEVINYLNKLFSIILKCLSSTQIWLERLISLMAGTIHKRHEGRLLVYGVLIMK